jgi:hypothetical protein
MIMRTNFLAVVIAAVAYWLLGALWYGLLFGKQWMALEHMTIEQTKVMNPTIPYIVAFLLELLVAYSVAQLCIWRNADTVGRGTSVGVLVWIGFIGPLSAMNYMFEMRSWHLFAINEFYPLFGLALMGAIIGAWPKRTK